MSTFCSFRRLTVEWDNPELCYWILEKYDHIGEKGAELDDVLQFALQNNRISFIRWLLKMPTFNVLRKDASNMCALDHALQQRKPDALRVLVRRFVASRAAFPGCFNATRALPAVARMSLSHPHRTSVAAFTARRVLFACHSQHLGVSHQRATPCTPQDSRRPGALPRELE